MNKALGMIETWGLAVSIEVADAMLKSANINLLIQEKKDIALVTILVEGDVSAVQIAVDAGTQVAQHVGALISFCVMPNPGLSTRKLLIRKE
ncbi:BMC domain-containing protein [Aneurinibacillus terranovensis]|uniref:BMC domain-containing protein n=1 Tax=Aneurinibacillus terranovensis TaxID=278991 RepID=UPI000684BA04|nr:BMC domain-containing protein [Aneurinibacillus terranovensis]